MVGGGGGGKRGSMKWGRKRRGEGVVGRGEKEERRDGVEIEKKNGEWG